MSEAIKEAFLGIDTSNYRTSAALYFADGTYQNSRKLLPVPKGEKGLRQNDAVFAHVKQFAEVFSKLDLENTVIKGVGVSVSPRNTAGSYMPCFSFGQTVAYSLAHAYGVKCYDFSHQQGHIAAGLLSCGRLDLIDREFYAVHASGGTTEILSLSGLDNIDISSKTRDISVGQLIDRTGVLLGCDFPCGVELEEIAAGYSEKIKIKINLKDGDCCLSGYENKVKDFLSQGMSREYISAYIIDVCGYTIADMLVFLENKKRLPVLCAGGVMANKRIKKIIETEFKHHGHEAPNYASVELSGDNAVGVAYLACRSFNREVNYES
ncbi:MAG: peptidase M22 [Clostridia bacterium]|nr:peptidase M22 [Clostridia bacterium]